MSARRRLVVLALLALPLVSVPFGLAAGKPQETLDGTLRTWHGDTFSTPVGVGAGVDTTVAGLVALEAPGQAVQALAGRKVRAHGERRNGVFAATGGVQATTDAAAAAVTGTKSVAVLLFNFSNNLAQPWTPAAVQGVVFDNANSVDEYLRDASYGQLSLTGDVHGWYTIDASNAGCAYTTWASQARSKATAAGVNLSAYQYVVYAFPQATSCGWAGLAYLPGTSSWINGAMTLRVVSHEVSHNLGVHHASTLACTTGGLRTTFGGSCSQSEYGDPFTVMGGAQTRHHVNWHRAQLGWLPDVQTVTTSGTYLLTPAEFSGTPRLVRVARGDGTYLNLEFRQPWGTLFDDFSASDPVVNGVSIRIAPATSSIVQSKLVDANPSTTTFSDAALGVGKTVVDPLTGVSVTTLSVGPAGASVSIQMPGGGDTQAPSGPVVAVGHRDQLVVRPAQLAGCDRQRRRRGLSRVPERLAGHRDDGALVSRHGPHTVDDVRVRGSGLRRRRKCRCACDGERDDAGRRRHRSAVRPDGPHGNGAEGSRGRPLVERVDRQRRRGRLRRLPQRDAYRRPDRYVVLRSPGSWHVHVSGARA